MAEPSLAETAADWLVRLDSDDRAERDRARAGFAAWKAEDPRHAAAAEGLERFLRQVRGLRADGPAAGAALRSSLAAGQRRRGRAARAAGLAAVALALALPVGMALREAPGSPWAAEVADVRNSAGEWRQQVLEDGSRLTLGGAGAVRLHFDAGQRVVELLRGSLLVEVAHDAGRPFYVQTALGRVRALGTRFTVTLDAEGMRVEMLESRVALQTAAQWRAGAAQATELRAGERATVAPAGIGPVQPVDRDAVESGWRRHQLVVEDRPLAEVLEQLARHHRGRLVFDAAELAGMRMTGVLPLDDSGRALELLQHSFPRLRVRSLASRWVWVDLAAPS